MNQLLFTFTFIQTLMVGYTTYLDEGYQLRVIVWEFLHDEKYNSFEYLLFYKI